MDNELISESGHVTDHLLESSRRSQLWTLVTTLLVIVLVVAGGSVVNYLVLQSNHKAAHQTIAGLESTVSNQSTEIAGLQSKSKEQTKAETQLRTVIANQACALTDAVTTNAIIRQFLVAIIGTTSKDPATVRTADAALQTVVAEIHDEKAPRGCHDPPTSGLTARHGR